MNTFYIIRHGKYLTPKGIIPYRLPGFHLAPEGIEKVQQLSEQLKDVPFVAIYTSPMERTQETASILARPHGLIPVIDERLLEVRSPAQGLTVPEIEAITPFDWNIYDTEWRKAGNGESIEDVFSRTDAIIQEKMREHQGKVFALVTHGDQTMLMAAHYMGIPRETKSLLKLPYVPMAGGFKIEIDGINATVTPLHTL